MKIFSEKYIDIFFGCVILILVIITDIEKGKTMALKKSKQREQIKQFLMTRKDHPTADVVYMNVRKENPNISLGTVYRNLTLLSEIGEIQRLRMGDGVDHFDADTSQHYHFICKECGSVIDLALDALPDTCGIAGQNFDGEIAGCVTYFYGKCKACCNVCSRENL